MEKNRLNYVVLISVVSYSLMLSATTITSIPEIQIVDHIGVKSVSSVEFGGLHQDTQLSSDPNDNIIKIGTDGSVEVGRGIAHGYRVYGSMAGHFAVAGNHSIDVHIKHSEKGEPGVEGIEGFICHGEKNGIIQEGCSEGEGAQSIDSGHVAYGATVILSDKLHLRSNRINLGAVRIVANPT